MKNYFFLPTFLHKTNTHTSKNICRQQSTPVIIMNSFKKPQLEVFPYQFSPHNPLKISIWGEFKWDTYENKDNSMHMVRLQIKRSNESHTVVVPIYF